MWLRHGRDGTQFLINAVCWEEVHSSSWILARQNTKAGWSFNAVVGMRWLMVGIEMNRTLDRTKLMTRSSAGTGKRGVRCDRLNPGFEDSGHKEIIGLKRMNNCNWRKGQTLRDYRYRWTSSTTEKPSCLPVKKSLSTHLKEGATFKGMAVVNGGKVLVSVNL